MFGEFRQIKRTFPIVNNGDKSNLTWKKSYQKEDGHSTLVERTHLHSKLRPTPSYLTYSFPSTHLHPKFHNYFKSKPHLGFPSRQDLEYDQRTLLTLKVSIRFRRPRRSPPLCFAFLTPIPSQNLYST